MISLEVDFVSCLFAAYVSVCFVRHIKPERGGRPASGLDPSVCVSVAGHAQTLLTEVLLLGQIRFAPLAVKRRFVESAGEGG